MKNKTAFTIAEILITLMIIGIVASMTIPSLIKSWQNTQIVSALKVNFSIINQATLSLIANNDGELTSVPTMNDYKQKLKIIKDCGGVPQTYTECWCNGGDCKNLYGNIHNEPWAYKAMIINGASIFILPISSDCSADYGTGALDGRVCGFFGLDVNGNNEPNRFGRDIFFFYITRTGLIPFGASIDETMGGYCNPTDENWDSGAGCAGKVLNEGAINY